MSFYKLTYRTYRMYLLDNCWITLRLKYEIFALKSFSAENSLNATAPKYGTCVFVQSNELEWRANFSFRRGRKRRGWAHFVNTRREVITALSADFIILFVIMKGMVHVGRAMALLSLLGVIIISFSWYKLYNGERDILAMSRRIITRITI